ncbi:MAG TPA: Gfo/Idh/MocA family oxidoreductase [Bauldia sp.]|nr:Gfo/Idh/MocA family oxidoreductase [Bauldia sp.]
MGRKLRWGVLGAAGIAKGVLIPAIQASRNGAVAVLGTRDPAALGAFAAEHRIGRVVTGYEAVIANPDVDALYIPLPNSLHSEWAERAADAGKPVLCEKPLAMTAAEAERMAARFAGKRVPLMEGFMYRFHPQHARVQAIIDSGEIGELTEVHAHLSVDLMNPPDPKNVRFAPPLGGGALLDMGCYAVSIARMIFGAEPTRVLAWQSLDSTFGVDIATSAVLEFPGGRVASASCSFKGNGQGFYRVIGRKGMIDVPRGILPGLGERSAEALVVVIDGNGRRREEEIAPADQYRLMVEAFADAVIDSRPVPLSPSDSIANMRVLDAIAASAAKGAAVSL